MAYNQQYSYPPPSGQQRRPPRGPPPSNYPPQQYASNNSYDQQYAQDGYYDEPAYDYPPQQYHGHRQQPPLGRGGYGQRGPGPRPGPRPDNRMRGPPPGNYQRRDEYSERQWQGGQQWPQDRDQYDYNGPRSPQSRQPGPPRQGQPYRQNEDPRQHRGWSDGPQGQRQQDYHGYDSAPRQDYPPNRQQDGDYHDRQWQGAPRSQEQDRFNQSYDNGYADYDSGPLPQPPQVFNDQRRPSHSNSDLGPARPTEKIYQQPQYSQSVQNQAQAIEDDHRPPRNRPPPLDMSNQGQYGSLDQPRRPLVEPVSPIDLPQDNAFPLFPTAKTKPPPAQGRDRAAEQPNEAPSRVQNFARDHLGEPPLQSPTIRLEPPSPVRLPSSESAPQRNGPTPLATSTSAGDLPSQRSFENGNGQLPQSRSLTRLGTAPQDRFDDARTPAKEVPRGVSPQDRFQDTGAQGRLNQSSNPPEQPLQGQALPHRGRPDNSAYDVPRVSPVQSRFGGPGPVIPDDPEPTSRDPYADESGPLPSPQNVFAGQTPASPRPNGRAHVRVSSQSEIYANGYINDIGQLSRTPEPSRDAQIEAEMPNFANMDDSQYAPHRSGQMVDQHLDNPPANRQDQYSARNGSLTPDMRPPPVPLAPTYQNPSGAVSAPNMQPGPMRGPPSGSSTGPHPANQPPKLYQDQYQQRPPVGGPMGGPTGPPQSPMGNPAQGYGPRPIPQRPGTAGDPVRPSFENNRPGNFQSASGRAPSAPPVGHTQAMAGTPLSKQVSNPDALPAHPVPVRPGLMNGGSSGRQDQRVAGPPQGRSASGSAPSNPDSRRSSGNTPVTQAEINHLQALVNAHPQDSATALLLAKKLVEASSVLASENGRLDARQTAKNRERYVLDAHRRVKKLVSNGYPDAMFYLADCYGQGLLGLPDDPKEAFNLYQAAAKAGHGQAAYRTAMCCEIGPEEGGGTRKDPQKAVQWYRRAAQLQDVAAMYKLGIICLRGLLAEQKNVVEAERWLKRAAEKADKENPHALHELAALYEPDNADRDVKAKIIPDEKYSRELFFQAANFGYMKSQFRLGQAYEYGTLGLPVDARNSIAWYSKAAAQGEHQAELALSGWYLTGAEGILPNSDQEAYLWARKAAMADPPLAKAMFAMGYYTETGIGCTASLDEAKKWYARAASYKFPKAIDRLEELKRGGGGKKDVRAGPGGAGVVRKEAKDRVR